MRSKQLMLGVLAAAALTGSAVAVATESSEPQTARYANEAGGLTAVGVNSNGSLVVPPGATPTAPKREHSDRGVDPAAKAALGVLRREKASGDSLPERAAVPMLDEFGAVNDSARLATTTERGEGFYVMGAADSHVCLVEDNGAGTCNDLEALKSGYIVVAAEGIPGLHAGSVRVSGLVPDGVESVTVEAADGSSVAAPVEGNVYVAVVDGTPDQVVWTGSDGSHTIQVPYTTED